MSRNRITRWRGNRRNRITTPDGQEIGPIEAGQRKANVLAQGGVSIEHRHELARERGDKQP